MMFVGGCDLENEGQPWGLVLFTLTRLLQVLKPPIWGTLPDQPFLGSSFQSYCKGCAKPFYSVGRPGPFVMLVYLETIIFRKGTQVGVTPSK